MFAETLFWGTSATLARYVFRDHHVPPAVAVELRLLIAVTLLGPWLALRRPGLVAGAFLVGYGLDHAENFRHLPYVASLR